MGYILAIDQGTTSSTALIMDQKGQTIVGESYEIKQHYPSSGWIEHRAHDIKYSVEKAVDSVISKAGISKNQIIGIGLTNQRETFSFFDNQGWHYPFTVWQCRRSSHICHDLKQQGLDKKLNQITGLTIDPYFSASKIKWWLTKKPSLKEKALRGELKFGTIDTFLCHWLSGGVLHITDITNASRTMLMDLSSGTWSLECLDIFDIPKKILPEIKENLGPYGVTKGLSFLPDGIPIAAMAGDQQAALFGQTCFAPGEAKATFGTGSFILLNTGTNIKLSKNGLLTSVAHKINGHTNYCLEGSSFICGALIQFLRDSIGMINKAHEIEELALGVSNSEQVLFIPALCGLGAPYWLPDLRGAILGLERSTTKGHIARAALEAIALQNYKIIEAMALDSLPLKSLKVDGGAANNDLLIKIQANLLGIKCLRPNNAQQTSLGAAYLAALAMGVFDDLKQISKLNDKNITQFNPSDEQVWAKDLIKRYDEAIRRLS